MSRLEGTHGLNISDGSQDLGFKGGAEGGQGWFEGGRLLGAKG